MSRRTDRLKERWTAEALDAARDKARAQGREPTAAEFTEAINGVGEPPKRRRRQFPRLPKDQRAWHFSMWLSYGGAWLKSIQEAPGGFDPVHLAAETFTKGYCDEADCHKAIAKARKRIALIESVLAEVEKQKKAPSTTHG
jgi:hypothetical protein